MSPASNSHAFRDIALLLILTIASLAPFLGKAFHIDDPVYIRVAQHLEDHPFDPYGFEMNWYGAAMPVHAFNQNPPGVSVYVALAGTLVGWSEVAIHAVMLLPAIAVVLGVYTLARAMTRQPLIAALAALFSPAFLVSATNVMADVLLLAFYVWAVAAWVHGHRRKNAWLLGIACIFASAAFFTKYFGVTLIPLLFAYGLAHHRKAGTWAAWLLIPAAAIVAYQAWSAQVYGHSLFSTATAYAAEHGAAGSQQSLFAMGGTVLCFIGGCFVSALFFNPFLWRRHALIGGFLLVVIAAVMPLYSETFVRPELAPHTELSPLSHLLVGLFIATGIQLCILACMKLRSGDSNAILLFFWFFGTLVFAAYVNWTVNARALLPLAPVAGILIARRLDTMPERASRRGLVGAVVVSAVVALWVAAGDYEFAGASRSAAQQLAGEQSEEDFYFQGHWGFQYYMEEAGFSAQDFESTQLKPGDVIAIPENNTNVQYYDPAQVTRIETIEIPQRSFMATTNIGVGAGFYSHGYGPLPFVVGSRGAQRVELFRVNAADTP